MSINKEWEMVREFHEKFNHPKPDAPVMLTAERAQKRYNWMKEEIDEFLAAPDLTEQADAMIDVIYFALGTLVEMGVRPAELFGVVQRANMAKLWPDGKPHYNAEGKTIKPQGWKDPHDELTEAIAAQIKI